MKRILFVDDEPRVLDGLARILHARRRVWELSFAVGGAAALKQLEQDAFDVVVSDLRMPDVDGLDVLTYVRDHQPGAVRIALSGQTDLRMLTQTVSMVHQILSKPCDAQTLVAVIERVVSMQAVLGHPELRQVVGQLGDLPVLPRSYAQFADALDDPDVPIREIVGIVEQDVGLTARCLQLANSAYFGLRGGVETLHQAVMFLGTSMLRSLVLSSAVFSAFTPSAQLSHEMLEAIQHHSMAVASVARQLVDDAELGEQAFMAGMLHDVGRIVLAASRPADPRTLLLVLAEGAHPSDPAPSNPGAAVTHAEIGAYLLGVWGLPHAIVEAVALHHQLDHPSGGRFDVLGAVQVAEQLVQVQLTACAEARRDLELQLLAFLSRFNLGESSDPSERLADLSARAAGLLGAT
jgi:HD-like signal output (HDOD) protein